MTDTQKLKEKIKDSGYKIGFLANKLDLSRAALSMKINNQSAFNTEEMYKLCDLIHLDDTEARRIFFESIVDKMETKRQK